MSALDYSSSNEIFKIPISPYGRKDKKTKVNIDLILRFFTVSTQTHTHLGSKRVTLTYTLGEKRQICICICMCVYLFCLLCLPDWATPAAGAANKMACYSLMLCRWSYLPMPPYPPLWRTRWFQTPGRGLCSADG